MDGVELLKVTRKIKPEILIKVPALNDRRDDIPLLVNFLERKFRRNMELLPKFFQTRQLPY